jgi:hypothetical protein
LWPVHKGREDGDFDVVGLNKAEYKAQIRGLKKERDAARDAHDHEALHVIRRKLHHLRREMHKNTV